MRKNERRNRKHHGPAPVKHFKRTLEVGPDTWSWMPFKGRLRLRGPDGTNYEAPSEAFRSVIQYAWGYNEAEEKGLPYYCCEFCSPTYGGPGFTPRLIRRYIQVVILGGQEWDREAEWKKLAWVKGPSVYFSSKPKAFPFREARGG